MSHVTQERFQPHLRDGLNLPRVDIRAFDTSNPHIIEGLIWASLCAATVKRYCAHMTQRVFNVAMSTQTVAKCIHHVLGDVVRALIHEQHRVHRCIERCHRISGRQRPARSS